VHTRAYISVIPSNTRIYIYIYTHTGIFLDCVFLRILRSNNSTFAHKHMALKVVSNLCQDPQTIVDVFVNYDCEEDRCVCVCVSM
jgi:hypothetical protein